MRIMIRNTQYTLRVNLDGTFRNGQVECVEVLTSGREVPAPTIDIEQASLAGLLEAFNADMLRENQALKAAAAQVAIDRQSQFDAIAAQVAANNTAHEAQVRSLTSQLASAQSELATNAGAAERVMALQEQAKALEDRMARLLDQLKFNPRELTVPAFLNRLTQTELLMLFSDEDKNIQAIAGMLKQWAANEWPVHLDSDHMKGAIGYLVSVDKLSQDRVAAISADASRAESVPPVI